MSVNKVILIGNVGKDPEVRYYDNGGCVASFSLATSERGYTSASGAQIPDRTEWHNIVLWRGLAEVAEKYVKKGSKLYIEGKIRSRSYDDASGNKRYVTEIYGDTMEMLGGRPEGSSSGAFPPPPPAEAAPQKPKTSTIPESGAPIQPDDSDLDTGKGDDLPF
ncbi:MAG: single-stranded DNA-binding protein [Dysgonamonadaceae bacterium]|jgi:single-strand DNA-binding protein|nr:single-stranded DNA-binding protein [Dysgonamonadaceae bacterium]